MSSITDLQLKLLLFIYCLNPDNHWLSLTPIVMHFKHVALARTVWEALFSVFIIALALLFTEMRLSDLSKKPHLLPSGYICSLFLPFAAAWSQTSQHTWVWRPFHCSNNLRLPLISLPYKNFTLISLRPGFHQDPASWPCSCKCIR